MAEWIIKVLVDASKPENTFEEKNLPGNKNIWGTQRDFVGRHPAGQAVRNFFRQGFAVDFDDMAFDKVYFVGSQYDEKGDATWFIPYRQSGPDGPLGRRHWAPVKILRDTRAEKQAEAEAKRQEIGDKEREIADQIAMMEQQVKEAELAQKLAELQRKRDAILQGSPQNPGPLPPNLPPAPGAFRTYELFGILNNVNVPLAQVVICDRTTGHCSVVPGGRVMVGEQPTDGFGFAGIPGRWQQFYPGRSPAEFGLDADKGVLGFDGTRAWVLDARFLSQVFGTNWRAALYS